MTEHPIVESTYTQPSMNSTFLSIRLKCQDCTWAASLILPRKTRPQREYIDTLKELHP